jgi:hypothetical protein
MNIRTLVKLGFGMGFILLNCMYLGPNIDLLIGGVAINGTMLSIFMVFMHFSMMKTWGEDYLED